MKRRALLAGAPLAGLFLLAGGDGGGGDGGDELGLELQATAAETTVLQSVVVQAYKLGYTEVADAIAVAVLVVTYVYATRKEPLEIWALVHNGSPALQAKQ